MLSFTFSANQASPELPEDVKNGSEVRNLYKSIGDPPSGGIKSVTEGVLVSPFLLAVLGAGGSLLLLAAVA